MPPIDPIIASSGPACSLACSGSPSTQAFETCSAIGEQSFSQVGIVASTHCLGVQAVVVRAPAGSAVTPSSQTSARATASAALFTSTEDAGWLAGICDVASCRARS